MRRSTTSAGTDRLRVGLLLLVALVAAATLIARPAAPQPPSLPDAAPAAATHSAAASTTLVLPDGRAVHLVALAPATDRLLIRIAGQIGGAAEVVTAFWGPDWPRAITITAAGTDGQFRALAGFGADVAAASTAGGLVFAPGATTMDDAALRIVLRHELFHHAARPVTATAAPRWLTEGVADFVARPRGPAPAPLAALMQLPTDAELDTAGPARSVAYDRAWWFARYVADRYGTAALRRLYLRACGPGRAEVAAAVQEALGAGLPAVLSGWRQWQPG